MLRKKRRRMFDFLNKVENLQLYYLAKQTRVQVSFSVLPACFCSLHFSNFTQNIPM